MNNGYLKLANAIVLQAVKDYRKALSNIKKKPDDKDMLAMKSEVEFFFRSEWYLQLTSVDSETLIKQLNQEVSA